ncbi:kynurenine 3-monooxygenase [Anabrus simplex]|uniref:kynurenine 3-monooxygenase n=1 Tax=Anabrus simplex TaxID=316456 RepID=UPI0035A2A35F
MDEKKVAVIGGGLVGPLCACFLARRGHEVHLYEFRGDIRQAEHVRGRSINLALSARGRAALRQIGLEDKIVEHHAIPMGGRMIHRLDGSQYRIPYDPKNGQCIYSVSRRYLNEVLLTAAESYPNVKLHFDHKLVAADLSKGAMTFRIPDEKSEVCANADLIIGADGAFSSVRRHMMKRPLFNFSQTYIEHGYLELCIPAREDGEFAMHPNHLHIWPRGTFMLIALPNQTRSWTVTLFMPFAQFAALKTPGDVLQFFGQHFPDVIPLIGPQRLGADFFATQPSPLVSIKCNPYHVGGTALIIGDAAHAMVPFYGQGMNAGFEDCLLLDSLMEQHHSNFPLVLEQFSTTRAPDAEAICDLAMYNYIEMRDLVNKRSFLLRKKLDSFLSWMFPETWVPLYSSVTFSDMPYHRCVQNKDWQDNVIHRCVAMAVAAAGVGITVGAMAWF